MKSVNSIKIEVEKNGKIFSTTRKYTTLISSTNLITLENQLEEVIESFLKRLETENNIELQ